MPCYHPQKGYSRTGGGFSPSRKYSKTRNPTQVPCGQCIGCRLDRVQEWSVRCVHEAKLHEETSFLTLTYDDEHLPELGTLVPEHLRNFMKRLRDRVEPTRLRFYACGEYGGDGQRPHYHLLLFGMWFSDAAPRRKSKSGFLLYESPLLNACWKQGQAIIGRVTRESAAYTARYCLKKVSGPAAEQHYAGRHPEFARMSNKPGIGFGWLQRYENDAFPSAYVIIDGQKYPVPRYYKSKLRNRFQFPTSKRGGLLERDDLSATRAVIRRATNTPQFKDNNTEERLLERKAVQANKQSKIKRL